MSSGPEKQRNASLCNMGLAPPLYSYYNAITQIIALLSHYRTVSIDDADGPNAGLTESIQVVVMVVVVVVVVVMVVMVVVVSLEMHYTPHK
jgi:hypothetical protein